MAEELISGPATTEIIGNDDNSSSDLDALNKVDEVKEDVDTEETTATTGESEVDKEVDKDEEDKTEEVEDVTLASGKTRPAFSKIKEKYPNIFKDFPELREAIGREREYTELFPLVEDAKEAKESAEDYSFLQEIVARGTPEGTAEFLDVMKENNPTIYKGYVTTFLPALMEKDKQLYYDITLPIVDNILKSAFQEGQRNSNKNLEAAAAWISQYVFGSTDYAEGKKSAAVPKVEKKDDPEREELNKERNEYWQQRYNECYSTAVNTIDSRLNTLVEEQLGENHEFSAFEVEYIKEKAIKKVKDVLDSDTEHMSRMKRLWKQANNAKFSNQSRDSIISAFLSRAKLSLPEIVKSFKSKGKSRVTEKELENKTRKTGGGGASRSSGRSNVPSRPDYSKLSDMDLLNGRTS